MVVSEIFDEAPIQPNPPRPLNSALARIALDLNPHDATPSLPSAPAPLNATACSAPPIARRRRASQETALFRPRGPQSARHRGRGGDCRSVPPTGPPASEGRRD